MELAGLHHDRDRVFLLSTTHGAEHVDIAAGIATMSTYREEPEVARMLARGERLCGELQQVIDAARCRRCFQRLREASCLHYGTRDAAGEPTPAFRTVFLQETVSRGLLAPSFVISYGHGADDIARTVEIVDEALVTHANAPRGVERLLHGRPVQRLSVAQLPRSTLRSD
jgi:glutamate-1-semialdehyde 2,1-aminomutase